MADRTPTTCEVRPVVLLGPRGGEMRAWILQDDLAHNFKQLAGPFSARRDALKALAAFVNDDAEADLG